MTDSEEIAKLKAKIKEMKQKLNKIDELEKKIEANSASDKKHHEELKTLQQKNIDLQEKQVLQHGESAVWNKFGALSTPIVGVVISAVIYFLKNKSPITSQQIQPIKKDADDMSAKMTEILKVIKDKTE